MRITQVQNTSKFKQLHTVQAIPSPLHQSIFSSFGHTIDLHVPASLEVDHTTAFWWWILFLRRGIREAGVPRLCSPCSSLLEADDEDEALQETKWAWALSRCGEMPHPPPRNTCLGLLSEQEMNVYCVWVILLFESVYLWSLSHGFRVFATELTWLIFKLCDRSGNMLFFLVTTVTLFDSGFRRGTLWQGPLHLGDLVMVNLQNVGILQ